MPSFTDRTQKGTRSERTGISFFACMGPLLCPCRACSTPSTYPAHTWQLSWAKTWTCNTPHPQEQLQNSWGRVAWWQKYRALALIPGLLREGHPLVRPKGHGHSSTAPVPLHTHIIMPALPGCLSFSSCTGTHYTHHLCSRWYQTARRQALLTQLSLKVWMSLSHSLPVQHWTGEFNSPFYDLTTVFQYLTCGYKEDGGSFWNRNHMEDHRIIKL